MHPRLAVLWAAHQAAASATGSAAAGDAAARRAEVLQLHGAKVLQSAADQCAAATMLLGSDDVTTVAIAHDLALAALAAEPAARNLAATAYDRQRMLRGEPQKFGTQVVVRDGRRELWAVDAHTTDSERAKWSLPPLAELQRRATAG